ncbi:hypothetical protein G5714_002791 [Onychostoma macrolepis]|uniref:Uncharacterized protein n=1 Tax=Onychostoma macrolepis TaxID=369639 RepID=A0A7J6D828_9TELE|nr:hypothetical protein G5714_002791 [Onychostoma macrolepis]
MVCLFTDRLNINSTHGYITLQGQGKRLEKVRMIQSSMPILNLKLLCGPDQLNISLWRDEALCDLYIGDDIKETARTKQEIEILGVSQSGDTYTLLSSDDEVYTVSAEFYTGNLTNFIDELPINNRIVNVIPLA